MNPDWAPAFEMLAGQELSFEVKAFILELIAHWKGASVYDILYWADCKVPE